MGRSLGLAARSVSKSSARKIGNPALISVLNCWFRIRKSEPPTWRELVCLRKPPSAPPRFSTEYTYSPRSASFWRASAGVPAASTCEKTRPLASATRQTNSPMTFSVPHLKICGIGWKGWPFPYLYPGMILNTQFMFVRYALTFRLALAPVGSCSEISIHNSYSFGRLEAEFGGLQQRVKLPVGKSEFNLHAAGVNHQDSKQLSGAWIQFEQRVRTMSRRRNHWRCGRDCVVRSAQVTSQHNAPRFYYARRVFKN